MKIETDSQGNILVLETRDGGFHRRMIPVGADVAGEPAAVREAAEAAWTEPVRTAARDREAALAPPPPDPRQHFDEQVREECARRLCRAFGARDKAHLDQIAAQATQEAVALIDKRARSGLTEAEEARAQALRAAQAAMAAHGLASAALRAMEPAPADFADDRWWPEPLDKEAGK